MFPKLLPLQGTHEPAPVVGASLYPKLGAVSYPLGYPFEGRDRNRQAVFEPGYVLSLRLIEEIPKIHQDSLSPKLLRLDGKPGLLDWVGSIGSWYVKD